MSNLLEVIRSGKKIWQALEDGDVGWTQKAAFRTKQSKPLMRFETFEDFDRVCFACSMGLLDIFYDTDRWVDGEQPDIDRLTSDPFRKARNKFNNVIGKEHTIISWNDRSFRKKEDVIEAFKRADL